MCVWGGGGVVIIILKLCIVCLFLAGFFPLMFSDMVSSLFHKLSAYLSQ